MVKAQQKRGIFTSLFIGNMVKLNVDGRYKQNEFSENCGKQFRSFFTGQLDNLHLLCISHIAFKYILCYYAIFSNCKRENEENGKRYETAGNQRNAQQNIYYIYIETFYLIIYSYNLKNIKKLQRIGGVQQYIHFGYTTTTTNTALSIALCAAVVLLLKLVYNKPYTKQKHSKQQTVSFLVLQQESNIEHNMAQFSNEIDLILNLLL